MEWKDETGRGKTFEARAGLVRLVVVKGHIDYADGVLICHCYPLFSDKKLRATDLDEAKAEAIALARAWLESALSKLK